MEECVAIIATYVFVAVATFIIASVIKLFVSLRVDEEDESMGLDITMHGEKAYHETI